MTTHHRIRRLATVLPVLGLVLATAACGSDDDASDSPTPADTTTETSATVDGTSAPAEADSDGDGLAAAQAIVEQYLQAPTESILPDPVESVPADVSVYFIECGVLSCQLIGDGIEEAADSLGWTVTRIPAGATPEETNAAWTRAAEDKPDVVMSGGASTELYASQLATLEDAGIPVIQYSIPEGVGNGVVANIISVDRFKLQGELMAAYVTAQSEGAANAVFFYAPDFAILEVEREAFEASFAEYCPACGYEAVAISAADIGTALPAQVVAYLQANPDTNWIVGAFAEVLIGVEPALAEAGLLDGVQAIAQGGSPDTYSRIVNGQLEAADIGMALEFVGYLSIDAAVRVLNGDDVSNHDVHLPIQILTEENIDDPAVNWPGIDGYQALFQGLWGV